MISREEFLTRKNELDLQMEQVRERANETRLTLSEEERKEIPRDAVRAILQNFSLALSGDIDHTIRKRLLHLLIKEITIDRDRNIFSDYYSNRNLTKTEFYSVADTLYDLNNFWMLSGFIRQKCRFGKDTMLSRMFQVMENFQLDGCMVAENMDLGYTAETRRIKAYAFTTRSGKNVPQIILQGNWVEKWGYESGCSVTVECYQNKLVILKD